jgi:DNA-binding GntR family transcriptional regulator
MRLVVKDDFIEKEMKFNIRNCISSIEARAIAPKVAEILNTQVNEPALYMSSISYLNTGEPFVYYRQYFLGTHFRFKHNFSRK